MKTSNFVLRCAVLRCAVILCLLGCARVSLDTRKPIKFDVTMRLDIYQHVESDADAIEQMISSPEPQKPALEKTSLLFLGPAEAYAQEEAGFSPEVQAAIGRRQERRQALLSWEARGVIGEDSAGLVQIRDSSSADAAATALLEAENKDRSVIYQYVAHKNGADLKETAKIFAGRIQKDVPAGTPVEVQGPEGRTQWMIKQ